MKRLLELVRMNEFSFRDVGQMLWYNRKSISVFVEVRTIISCKSIAFRRFVSFCGFQRIFWCSSFDHWDGFEGSWDIFCVFVFLYQVLSTPGLYRKAFCGCICWCVLVCVTQTLSDNIVRVIGCSQMVRRLYTVGGEDPAVWCQENNISLNKTEEMITD